MRWGLVGLLIFFGFGRNTVASEFRGRLGNLWEGFSLCLCMVYAIWNLGFGLIGSEIPVSVIDRSISGQRIVVDGG